MLRPQHLCQLFQLRAFAASVEPFEGNKSSALGMRRHGEIIAERPPVTNLDLQPKNRIETFLLYSEVLDSLLQKPREIQMHRSGRVWLCVFFVLALIVPVLAQNASNAPTITIAVDASDAPRKIIHAQLTIPAAPGSMTLYYPKWIPGEHGPTGPIQNLTGLTFTANGQTLK